MHSLDRISLAIQFECFRSRKLAKILHPTVEFAQPTEKVFASPVKTSLEFHYCNFDQEMFKNAAKITGFE